MSRLQNALDEQFPNKLSGQKVDEFLSSVTTDTLQRILTLNLDDSVAIDGMMKNEEFWNVVNNGLMKSSEIDQNTSNFIKTTIDRAKTDKELFKIILKSFKIYANEDLRQRNNINGTLDLNNLDTPASQKAILSLFSRDKLLYDTLIKQL